MNPPRRDSKTSPSRRSKKDPYTDLLRELAALHQDLTTLEGESSEVLQKVHAGHQVSAANLIHYLGLRRRDVRRGRTACSR